VHEAVFDSMPHAMSHGSTFAPNELAMAAGLATLHELREQRLVEASARLGQRLLELTRPLVDEFEVVRDVRGLGLAWAIEFAEPQGGGRLTYRMIERAQRGLFAQLVAVPLFTKRHILTQVAGHDMAVIRILPPLVVTDEDVEEFADALRATIKGAQRMPSLTKFALTAASAGLSRR
jgi:ornithine--oxo-acid transaminase